MKSRQVSDKDGRQYQTIMGDNKADDEQFPDMSLLDITEGENERKIPVAKFIDDIGAFSASFEPPASSELLIGAYTELHNKYKTFEATLSRKGKFWCEKRAIRCSRRSTSFSHLSAAAVVIAVT